MSIQTSRLVTALGHRYRLHRKDLPGKPDLVFGPKRKVIFVHGCFWHQHARATCLDGRRPNSNTGYSPPKLMRNVARDQDHRAALRKQGWRVLVVWECEAKDNARLSAKLVRFLDQA